MSASGLNPTDFLTRAETALNQLALQEAEKLDPAKGAAIMEAGQIIHCSIASLYFIQEEGRLISENFGGLTSEEDAQAKNDTFEAKQAVIALALEKFPALFREIPEELEDQISYELFSRPTMHVCGEVKHTFSEDSLANQEICPITRNPIGKERVYDHETQEAVYNFVLTTLGVIEAPVKEEPAEPSSSTPPPVDTQPSPEPVPYPHNQGASSSYSTLPAYDQMPTPTYAFAPVNQYNKVFTQLYSNPEHVYSSCTAIAGHAISEMLSVPAGTPTDLGKILWEGHQIMAKEIEKHSQMGEYTQLAFGDIATSFEKLHFPKIGELPGLVQIQENAATCYCGQIPHDDTDSYYTDLLKRFAISAVEWGNSNMGVIITHGGATYGLTFHVLEAEPKITFFDSHGENGGPASLTTFYTITGVAQFLARKFPHFPNDGFMEEGASLINFYPVVSAYAVQTQPTFSFAAMSSSSVVEQQPVQISDRTRMEWVAHDLDCLLKRDSNDPSFGGWAYECYRNLGALEKTPLVNRVYFEYYKLLTGTLGWKSNGSFNWAEQCFLAQSFFTPGLPPVPHMVALRLTAIRNALETSQ